MHVFILFAIVIEVTDNYVNRAAMTMRNTCTYTHTSLISSSGDMNFASIFKSTSLSWGGGGRGGRRQSQACRDLCRRGCVTWEEAGSSGKDCRLCLMCHILSKYLRSHCQHVQCIQKILQNVVSMPSMYIKNMHAYTRYTIVKHARLRVSYQSMCH